MAKTSDPTKYPYDERIRPPKYNVAIPLRKLFGGNAKRYAPKFFPGWTSEDHLDAALGMLERKLKAEEEHQRLVKAAERQFGDYGPLISGGLRGHWPESTKEPIRAMAHLISAADDAAQFHHAASGSRRHYTRFRDGAYGLVERK